MSCTVGGYWAKWYGLIKEAILTLLIDQFIITYFDKIVKYY